LDNHLVVLVFCLVGLSILKCCDLIFNCILFVINLYFVFFEIGLNYLEVPLMDLLIKLLFMLFDGTLY
jgi:hypothetical protein